MKTVLLDFDGTITRRDTTRFLVFALLRARPWCVFRVIAPLFLLATGGSAQQIQNAKDQCVGTLLRGLSGQQVRPILHRYCDDVLPLILPELATLMRDRAAVGQKILVVTASAEHAVREALSEFPVTVLGTRFEYTDGRFTGAVEGKGCYGPAKVPRIIEWGAAQTEPLRFLEAWSDSVSDLPMMKLAEKRVWVCRDSEQDKFQERDPEGEVFVVS